jgi:hypothetical protein
MADVMQALKKQKGSEDIPMLDIIKNDVEQSGGNFDEVYAKLKSGIDSGKMRIMRSGNTLLIYTIMQPGVAEVHVSTMDSPDKLVGAVQDLYQAMKAAGFKTGVTTTDNSQIARVMNAAKIPVKVKQVPGSQGQAQYQLTIEVK